MKRCSVNAERNLKEISKLANAVFGFVIVESISSEFIDKLCEELFKERGVEQPAKDSATYRSECLALLLANRDTRELFSLIGEFFSLIGLLYRYILAFAPVPEGKDSPVEH
jgi:hypothetical protein